MAGTRQPRKKRAAPSAADELRRQAEERLDKLSADASPVPEDIAAVVHELRVHQIELEMQNEELRRDLRVDVGERHPEGEGLAIGGALRSAFETCPEVAERRFGVRVAGGAPQPQLAGLWLAGLLEHAVVPVIPVSYTHLRAHE